jgi:hypothetical protein
VWALLLDELSYNRLVSTVFLKRYEDSHFLRFLRSRVPSFLL